MSDPFPSDHLSNFIRRLPAYARLAWNLGRDPLLSKARRGAVLAAAGYLISPLDLIPGIIPVLGQLDDMLVLLAALRFALHGLDPEQREVHLSAVGLSDAMLLEDVQTLGLTTAWLARAGARAAVRIGTFGLRATATIAARVAPKALRGAQRTGQAVEDRVRRSRSEAIEAQGSADMIAGGPGRSTPDGIAAG